MRVVVALLASLVVAVPALADDPDPYVRTCSSSAFGDLGRGWQKRAVVAGPLAFVGNEERPCVQPVSAEDSRRRRAEPHRDGDNRRALAGALAYNGIRHAGTGRVPLTSGTRSVRFEACGAVVPGSTRLPWNRGTQFPGYFLVNGPRCVHVEISAGGKLIRRALRFGVSRCA